MIAIYQPKTKTGSNAPETVSKKSCALISAPEHDPIPAALVLNFPDGLPPSITSAMSLLDSPELNGDGDWQQATGNEVPGKGSLAPSLQPVLPGMTPGDAFSVALYHWLRGQGPKVKVERLMTLLEAKWDGSDVIRRFQPEPSQTAADEINPNSCLAIDTGARQYAILNQTGPGGIGQTALSKVFGIYMSGLYGAPQQTFPQNAMPLFVDKKGNCNLSGRAGYDQHFIDDFMQSVYQSNLAAIESAAVARMVIARASTELSQLDQKIFIERQELNSVINRVVRLGRETKKSETKTPPDEVSHQIGLANEKIEALKQSIAGHEDDRLNLRHSAFLAQRVTTNANQVAASTFELCAHAFKLCKDGVFRIDKPTKAFIISRKFVFTPCVKPVDESDFFKPEALMSEISKAWIPKGFDVISTMENAHLNPETVIVEGQNLKTFNAIATPSQRANASVVFLTTESLLGAGQPQPLISNLYPFGNIRIPSGQLFYYCKDALRTGQKPKVSWSVVIRDLVASVGQNSYGQVTGHPIASDRQDWCKVVEQEGCPGIACELQIRTPLPLITNSAETSLSNPVTNAQVQQIPPVPPDML